jgi:hypothetical protein
MKKLLLVMMLCVSYVGISQVTIRDEESVELYHTPMGLHKLVKFKSVTVVYFAFYFRDSQYTQIVDYKYLTFNDAQEVKDFFTLVISSIDEKKEYELNVGTQRVSLVKKTGMVMLMAKGGYCYLNKKQAQSFIDAL